jgi:hypothetical protein
MPVYNDGKVLYGSRVLTLSSTGPCVADNISVSRPTTTIERTNEVGEPDGWVAIAAFETGTATIQLRDTATQYPKLGEVFPQDFDEDGTPENWVVTDVTQPEEKSTVRVMNIGFRRAYYPVTP